MPCQILNQALFFKVAAQFNEVKNVEETTATDSDELEREGSHVSPVSLLSQPVAPLFARLILELRNELLFGPEDHESVEELQEIDDMAHWRVL